MLASNRCCRLLACSVALALVAACSREAEPPEPAASVTGAPSPTIGTDPWVDDVHVSSAEGTDVSAQGLTPGTELQLSMSVEHAPTGTDVTAYWYGPENRQLAYETQTVEPKQRQMNFTQENTHDWQAGTYRAEIWAGGEKVKEQTFEIVSG
jgi:hypothetical protein